MPPEPTGRAPDSKLRTVRVAKVVVGVVLAAAIVVAAVLVARRVSEDWSAPPRTNPVAERGPLPSDDVVLLGDSITEQAEPVLKATLEPAFRLRVRARSAYRIDQLEPYAIEAATSSPEQVVINLGSNDVLNGWPLERSVAALRSMVDEFATVRCIHLVTVSEGLFSPIDADLHDRAVALNAEIRAIAARGGHGVIDWAGTLERDAAEGSPSGPLTSDSVHPSAAGQQRLASLYRDALTSCA